MGYCREREGIATETTQTDEKKSGLTGSSLKIVALAAMFLDHYAWSVIDGILKSEKITTFPSFALPDADWDLTALWALSILFHCIGRITMPIMLFLISEGLSHTRNVYRYGARFLLFALISEVPFDLAFYGRWFVPQAQNVFFTLFLALVAMAFLRFFGDRPLPVFAVVAVCLAAAYFLKCDYSYRGVLAGCVIELLRGKKTRSACGGCAVLAASGLREFPALLAIPLIHVYNGEKGLKFKYVFWCFYPLHLLLLFLIQKMI